MQLNAASLPYVGLMKPYHKHNKGESSTFDHVNVLLQLDFFLREGLSPCYLVK
jgi:hypothetical protein